MMFVQFNSNTTGVTCWAGTANPSGAPEFTPSFKWDLSCSIFSLLCNVFWSLFLSVLLFTASDYPFGIFNLFLSTCHYSSVFRLAWSRSSSATHDLLMLGGANQRTYKNFNNTFEAVLFIFGYRLTSRTDPWIAPNIASNNSIIITRTVSLFNAVQSSWINVQMNGQY